MSVTNFVAASHSNIAGATDTLAFPAPVGAGSTLVVMIRMGNATTLNSITDSVNGLGAPWTILTNIDNAPGRQYVAYIQNSLGGTPTLSFTYGASSQSPRYAMCEIAGALPGSFDVSASNTGSNATALTGGTTATTAQANEAWLGFFSNSGALTFSNVSPWTILGVEPAGAAARLAVVYQEPGAIGTPQAAITASVNTNYIGFTITFRESAAGLTLLAATATLAAAGVVSAGAALTATASQISASGAVASLTATATLTPLTGQIALPVSDVSVGAWTTDTGGTTGLYAAVGESTPNDGSYVQSPINPSSSQYTLRLGMLQPPIAGPRTLHIRHFNDTNGGQVTYTYELMQGSTVLETYGPFLLSSTTPTQVDAAVNAEVPDWGVPLDIRVTATQLS